MNFDKNKETLKDLVENQILSKKVTGIPCTIFMQDGKEVYRFLGDNVDKLEKKIQEHYH